jgi:CubicO group peptidase (beta-lactamase class C family)
MMQRTFVLWLALLTPLVPAGVATAAEWGTYSSARVDALAESYRSANSIPALSLAIGIDGRLVFAKGYGEARPGIPATEHSVYHIGSLTKQFTAAAVLSLIERQEKAPLSGLPMTLSTSIAEVLAGVDLWTTASQPAITLRGLLTMTSTLPSLSEHPPRTADPWGAISSERLLQELKRMRRAGPSHAFHYSNTDYFVLAQIIEAASASRSYRQVLRTSLTERAGMRDTGFIGDYAPRTELAVAVPSWDMRTISARRRPAFVERDWLKGSADMASSAFDLFVWNKAIMEGTVVSSSSREMMFSDAARVAASRYYGMGWFIEHAANADQYSHSGFVPGYSSLNVILRLRGGSWMSVSLLTNRDGVENLELLAAGILRIGVGRDWTQDRLLPRATRLCHAEAGGAGN